MNGLASHIVLKCGRLRMAHCVQSPVFRFVILLLSSLLTFGSYFAYDSIGATQPYLESQLQFDATEIGALYSAYSLPNLFMVFFGGLIIDKFGTSVSSLLFSCFVFGGAAVVGLSSSFPLMILGRAVFGIGSESLVVCQSTIASLWFTGKELALAFGLQLTIARLGTLGALNILSGATETLGLRGSLWLAAGMCLFSLVCNIGLALLQRMAGAARVGNDACHVLMYQAGVGRGGPVRKEDHTHSTHQLEEVDDCENEDHSPESITLPSIGSNVQLEEEDRGSGHDAEESSTGELDGDQSTLLEEGSETSRTQLSWYHRMQHQFRSGVRIIREFPQEYWWVTSLCVAFYSCVLPFVAFGVAFLSQVCILACCFPAHFSSVIPLSGPVHCAVTHCELTLVDSMVFAPIFGWLVDKWGRRTFIMLIGTTAMVPAYGFLAFPSTPVSTAVGPIPSIVLIGMCFSLVPAALWPTIPLLLSQSVVGVGFGLLTALQNVGLFCLPLVIGGLRSLTQSWEAAMLTFAVLSLLAVGCALMLWRRDRRQGGRLTFTAKRLAALETHGIENEGIDNEQ